jgi:alkylation response protein AidB-like acyl-CoA dehydrogenase
MKHGSAEQEAAIPSGMSNGTLIAANAMTEPQQVPTRFALATRAPPRGTGFRITGQKTFVSNGPVADLIVAYAAPTPRAATTEASRRLLVREIVLVCERDEVDKVSLRSCEMSDIIFDDAYVSGEAVLGKVGKRVDNFVQSMIGTQLS